MVRGKREKNKQTFFFPALWKILPNSTGFFCMSAVLWARPRQPCSENSLNICSATEQRWSGFCAAWLQTIMTDYCYCLCMFVFNQIDIIKPYLLFLKSLFSFAFHFSFAAFMGLYLGSSSVCLWYIMILSNFLHCLPEVFDYPWNSPFGITSGNCCI